MNNHQTIGPLVRNVELLSLREMQVLYLIIEEKSNKQIAIELGISKRTVETHRANLLLKLNVKTPVGLVKVVYKYIEEGPFQNMIKIISNSPKLRINTD